ncbi:hypothetical protein ABZ388_11620 [Micromonospora parva]|uniref:hypothetical protein n=1 Tax=Micromonospora parva TaxID=1464048 RepID=UPI0033FB7827
MSKPRSPGSPQQRPPRRRRGLLLLAVGVVLLVAAFWLPGWRSMYPDRTEVVPGARLVGWALPFAVIAAGSAVLSLTTTGGPARRVWRQASRGLLIANALACGSLTGVYWYFEAEDPFVGHELLSTAPGPGIVLALVGCLLIPLAGALPERHQPPNQPGGNQPGGNQPGGNQPGGNQPEDNQP